jgi:integrase
VLTVDQLEALADAAARADGGRYARNPMVCERDRLIVLVMGFGGLRAGEVGGLRVNDIQRNGKRCRLRIERAMVRETGAEPYVADLKTDAGRRMVSIPCSVADDLKAFIERWNITGHIFTKQNGRLAANDLNYVVNEAARRAGLPGVHAHGLRHTAASIAV